MAYELIYTSAPSGIKQGSNGYCVVACTRGMGPRLMSQLEGLTAYKPIFQHFSADAWNNPISYGHYLTQINGFQQHILFRTCFNGVDHTQRSNKLASFLILNGDECKQAQGGPASLYHLPGLFKDASWKIVSELYDKQKDIPATNPVTGIAQKWKEVTGDAGWAGYLAESFIESPQRNVYIVFDPLKHKTLDEMLNESLALIPAEQRWNVTFNTYLSLLPAGMSCLWRCCTSDSQILLQAHRNPSNIVIDLTKEIGKAPDSKYAEYARSGIRPSEIAEKHTQEHNSKNIVLRKKTKNNSVLESEQKKVNVSQESFPQLRIEEQDDWAETKKAQSKTKYVQAALIAVCMIVLIGVAVLFYKHNQNEERIAAFKLKIVEWNNLAEKIENQFIEEYKKAEPEEKIKSIKSREDIDIFCEEHVFLFEALREGAVQRYLDSISRYEDEIKDNASFAEKDEFKENIQNIEKRFTEAKEIIAKAQNIQTLIEARKQSIVSEPNLDDNTSPDEIANNTPQENSGDVGDNGNETGSQEDLSSNTNNEEKQRDEFNDKLSNLLAEAQGLIPKIEETISQKWNSLLELEQLEENNINQMNIILDSLKALESDKRLNEENFNSTLKRIEELRDNTTQKIKVYYDGVLNESKKEDGLEWMHEKYILDKNNDNAEAIPVGKLEGRTITVNSWGSVIGEISLNKPNCKSENTSDLVGVTGLIFEFKNGYVLVSKKEKNKQVDSNPNIRLTIKDEKMDSVEYKYIYFTRDYSKLRIKTSPPKITLSDNNKSFTIEISYETSEWPESAADMISVDAQYDSKSVAIDRPKVKIKKDQKQGVWEFKCETPKEIYRNIEKAESKKKDLERIEKDIDTYCNDHNRFEDVLDDKTILGKKHQYDNSQKYKDAREKCQEYKNAKEKHQDQRAEELKNQVIAAIKDILKNRPYSDIQEISTQGWWRDRNKSRETFNSEKKKLEELQGTKFDQNLLSITIEIDGTPIDNWLPES